MDHEENIEEQTTEDNYNVDDNILEGKEDVSSKVTAEDFDPERVLYDIKKTFNGFDKRNGIWVRVSEPIARSDFINLYINSLRSLLNFHNLFSQKTANEAAFDMLEGLNEITFAAVDYGIKEEHVETVVNIYDTLKSTFYGIIIEGRGTENVKQVLASVYQQLKDTQTNTKPNSLINWDNVNKSVRGKN
jgi:hypothetical protein